MSRDQRIKEQNQGRGGTRKGSEGGESDVQSTEAGGRQVRTGGEQTECQPGPPQKNSRGPTQRPPPIFSFVLPFRLTIFYQNTYFTYFSYLLCLVCLTPLEGKPHEGRNHVSLFTDGSLVTRAVFDKWETLLKYNHEMLK